MALLTVILVPSLEHQVPWMEMFFCLFSPGPCKQLALRRYSIKMEDLSK